MVQKTICISVRNLVEFLLRSGDLDNRYGGRKDAEAMQAGSRLHRKIQGSMRSGYQAEVTLKHLVELEEVLVSVEGRADGIWMDQGVCTIDEIKGTYQDVNQLPGALPAHLAQAKCYAYLYAVQQRLKTIRTRMIYANLDTEEMVYFTEDHTFSALEEWFLELMEAYKKWVVFEYNWKLRRKHTIQTMEFPYPYREGQRELVVSVYRSILRKKRLFIQAPTGVGKTLSALFPSLTKPR